MGTAYEKRVWALLWNWCAYKKSANKALHWMEIPLRSIPTSELVVRLQERRILIRNEV